MPTFEIKKPRFARLPSPRFYTGDETGALYFKADNSSMVCIIPGKDGPEVGSIQYNGGFTPVEPGALISITV